ncbi:MAG: hypothetical protein QOE72_336 [Chloroflexota bacterium]|jgi:hypothetical protein|nr:hypothetical protein [Chloroflexota bacterium]
MRRIIAVLGTAVLMAGTATAMGGVPHVSAYISDYCQYGVFADEPVMPLGPFPVGQPQPINYSGRGFCRGAFSGDVVTCLERSSWSGYRDVDCRSGHIDRQHPEVRNQGVGHCLRGTYTYRVHSTIMISTPGGDFNDAAYSSEHRWACP